MDIPTGSWSKWFTKGQVHKKHSYRQPIQVDEGARHHEMPERKQAKGTGKKRGDYNKETADKLLKPSC
jgi:hypothetical protein